MKKWQFVGTTALGATLLLGACGGGNGGSGNSDLKGEAKGDGSSTVAPIVEKLNEKWAQDHSDAKISAGQAGTGAGFVLMALNIRKIAAQRAVHYKIHIKKADFHQIINRNQLFYIA